jgi:hypothetical protein
MVVGCGVRRSLASRCSPLSLRTSHNRGVQVSQRRVPRRRPEPRNRPRTGEQTQRLPSLLAQKRGPLASQNLNRADCHRSAPLGLHSTDIVQEDRPRGCIGHDLETVSRCAPFHHLHVGTGAPPRRGPLSTRSQRPTRPLSPSTSYFSANSPIVAAPWNAPNPVSTSWPPSVERSAVQAMWSRGG